MQRRIGLLLPSDSVRSQFARGVERVISMAVILGISAFYHDSAAALLVDGKIVAAAQQERFSRKKHDAGFPDQAVDFCLKTAGLTADDLDYVGFYDKPLAKFERLLETYLAYAPVGFKSFLKAMPQWLQGKLYTRREIRKNLGKTTGNRIVFTDHHESHAASAFYPSPFEEAAILTLDGVGEWATAAAGYGRGREICLTRELQFPHSLGLLYSAFTYYCGFTVNSGEYKLMGLAPYGEPKYVELILDNLLDLKEDGSFRMDMSYFNYCQGLTMTSGKFDRLFGVPPRKADSEMSQLYMDIAASIQKVTEEIVLRMARHLYAETGMKNLCMAGGVALNCVANGRLLREGPFEDIWIQPAAGDAGGALGVAQFIWHQLMKKERTVASSDSQSGSLLGQEFSAEEIQEYLNTVNTDYRRYEDTDELCGDVADAIADGKVVGWFQGRAEYGPRALGSRSILGDSRNPAMQSVMNMKVKYREGFRPFAPAVLREKADKCFNVRENEDSPYMLMVTSIRDDKRSELSAEEQETKGLDKLHISRSEFPAITHVDFSARIQTVDVERHGLYRRVLEKFDEKTGCPTFVNTSFNLGWEPIVNSPADAYKTFMASDIDLLCMGPFLLDKTRQPAHVSVQAGNDLEVVLGDHWQSPCCHASMHVKDDRVVCAACLHEFNIHNNIPQLFWQHEDYGVGKDVTEVVKAFYEETPFPNYDEHDSLRSLIDKSRRGFYASILNDAIPYNSTVLEVGCGTGQLSNFLGIGNRRVIGADLCLNSLELAENFRRKHELSRVRFVQMNLFEPCFKPEQFDVVLCNGVLHHTNDPYGGFESIAKLVKPGGYIIIGLYNRFGRLATDLRRTIYKVTGGRGRWLDSCLRAMASDSDKHRAWYNDQYCHPHESKHTAGEVQQWFSENNLEFIRGIPDVGPNPQALNGEKLFQPALHGNGLTRAVSQFKQVFTGSREGGFFLTIGKKPVAAGSCCLKDGIEERVTRFAQAVRNRKATFSNSDTSEVHR